MNVMGLRSIWDCSEYMRGHMPPYHDAWDAAANRQRPIAFSFAYTPKGRVSRYWCSLALPGARDENEVRRWVAGGRPRLRRGYRWSEPYWYS